MWRAVAGDHTIWGVWRQFICSVKAGKTLKQSTGTRRKMDINSFALGRCCNEARRQIYWKWHCGCECLSAIRASPHLHFWWLLSGGAVNFQLNTPTPSAHGCEQNIRGEGCPSIYRAWMQDFVSVRQCLPMGSWMGSQPSSIRPAISLLPQRLSSQ